MNCCLPLSLKCSDTLGLLICPLISENQGLEKSKSVSNPRIFLGSANLDFVPGLQPEKSWVYTYYKPEKNLGVKTEKMSRFAEFEIFLGFEINLDFSRLWFSEIRVQIKRPSVSFWRAELQQQYNGAKSAKKNRWENTMNCLCQVY